jgi:hypothetical protein
MLALLTALLVAKDPPFPFPIPILADQEKTSCVYVPSQEQWLCPAGVNPPT